MGADHAELAVLGALIIDPKLMDESPPVLREPGVLSARGQRLYKAIVSCHQRHGTVDAVLVKGEMENGHRDDLVALMAEALQDCPMSANARRYADVLERQARRMELKNLALGLKEAIDNEDTPGTIREHLEILGSHLEPSYKKDLQPLDLQKVMDEEAEPVPWVVPGWLALQDFCVIGGEPATGKSVLALDLALALATGAEFLGMKVLGQFRVLYLDEEMPPALARRRIRMMMRGRELEPDQVALRYYNNNGLNLDQAESRLALRAVLDDFQPQVLMLDSLIRFHDRPENDNTEMAKFVRDVLRPIQTEYGTTVVALHHLAKPGKDKSKELGHRLRGASDLRAAVDHLWGLEGDPAGKTRTLTQDKNRWAEMAVPVSTVYIENDDRTSAVLKGETRSKDTEGIILDMLSDAQGEGVSRPTMIAELNAQGYRAADRLVSQTLKKLIREGTAKKNKIGRRMHYWHVDYAPQSALDFTENEGDGD